MNNMEHILLVFILGLLQCLCLLRCCMSDGGPSMFGNHFGSEVCANDGSSCKNKRHCWGYEKGCTDSSRWFLKPECNDEQGHRRFKTIDDKMHAWWREADFGFVKKVQDDLVTVCEPRNEGDSSFVCSKDMAYCRAKNLYMDFTDHPTNRGWLKDESPFKDGQIGGHCNFNPSGINSNVHRMSLSSWIVQVEKYSSLSFNPISDGHCDVIVEKPTYFMKLDATVNLYHHFCDYFNLYLTFHVNGSFSKDINIILWEESRRRSLGNFGATWKAFTDNEVLYLGEEYNYRKVCFKDAIFALLPRMVFGLFYNTPLVNGCFKTGLFKAFNRFLMERLDVKQERNSTSPDEPIRIGLLSRGTAYRQILNQQEIEKALKGLSGTKFEVLNYHWQMPFLDQMKQSHNLDIFIGMHGAGLTHMLFMPDWAAVFEVYNCGDKNCYKDLARLRGLNYYTWENEEKVVEKTENIDEKYGDNLKFRNFAFDVKEFMRIVSNMVEQVRKNLREYKDK